MIDIGIVGLDTSHPESFARSLDDVDHATISAVWDSGDVRDRSYVREFCETHDATLCEEPEEMVSLVDAAMILTVNWDTHARLASTFLDADVPTFVDKPIAGRLADLEAIADAAGTTPLLGGSSIPFHPALADFPASGGGRVLYCVGYNDPFYYGAHVVHSARHFADADWRSVTPADDPGTAVDVVFENETYATVRFDGVPPYEGGGFAFLGVGDTTDLALVGGDDGDREQMYRSYMESFVRAVRRGSTDRRRLLDGAGLLLAAHAALDADRTITRDRTELDAYHADGATFTDAYGRNH
ncbi:Gfo/Idh/MocA family oxidoreductase [Halomontanus rarus]|uniref:Gfo/Idh/MocA family oxidoreductase n=1 Tax=Halomontanus rarus TaxID=3034020 RepID=UPI001A99583D